MQKHIGGAGDVHALHKLHMIELDRSHLSYLHVHATISLSNFHHLFDVVCMKFAGTGKRFAKSRNKNYGRIGFPTFNDGNMFPSVKGFLRTHGE